MVRVCVCLDGVAANDARSILIGMGAPYLVILVTILLAVLGIAQAFKLMKKPRDPQVAIDFHLAGIALLLVTFLRRRRARTASPAPT